MLTCGLMQELGLSFVVIGLGIVVLGLVLLLITACCPESRRQRRGGYRSGEPSLSADQRIRELEAEIARLSAGR
jgi:hypothetical protein